MTTKLARWRLTTKSFHPQSYITFEHVVICGHMINEKHLHFHSAYGHQTWQGCHIQ